MKQIHRVTRSISDRPRVKEGREGAWLLTGAGNHWQVMSQGWPSPTEEGGSHVHSWGLQPMAMYSIWKRTLSASSMKKWQMLEEPVSNMKSWVHVLDYSCHLIRLYILYKPIV